MGFVHLAPRYSSIKFVDCYMHNPIGFKMKKYYICEKDFWHIYQSKPVTNCVIIMEDASSCGGNLKEFISKEDLKICIDAYLPEKIETEFDKGLVFMANRIINKIGAK